MPSTTMRPAPDTARDDAETTLRPRPSTGTLVTVGLTLLALLGVATVFGRTLVAALAPPTTGHDVDESR